MMGITDLELQLQIAHKVYENVVEGIVITDHRGIILWANPAFSSITGYTVEEAIGQNPRILKSDRHEKEFYANMWKSLKTHGQWQGEIWNRRKNGETYPEWMKISAIKDAANKNIYYVSVFNDMTEHVRQKELIQYQAYHDALTGLPNRFLFKDRLEMTLAHAQRHDEMMAVVFLNIDRFKRINETLGHAMGDKLIQDVAKRLKHCAHADDTVARFSGDEFGIIIREIKDIEALVKIVQDIASLLQQPFKILNQEIYMTSSMGISIYPSDGSDSETLIKHADIAMHRAKQDGRNGYQLYTPGMNKKAVFRLALENDLYKGIRENEFVLYYQPRVEVSSGKIVGAEALIRWQHPEKGLIFPGEFINLAEESGLILPLGEWVLRAACTYNKELQDQGLPKIPISVNLSTLQLREYGLIYELGRILLETGLEARFLELEITEGNVMKNVDFTNKILHQLKELGLKISIDDFGTGYSSLAYLSRFPIDAIKIDRSFVMNMLEEKESMGIVRAIMAMGKSLDLRIVAEGVESQEQVDCLKNEYCHEIQGYYFSPPVKPEEFEAMLKIGYIKV